MISDYDRQRIVAQAQAFMDAIVDDGDATEALAGLHAAGQVIERVLLQRGLCTLDHLAKIQIVGKRVGAGLNPILDLEVVGRKDVQ